MKNDALTGLILPQNAIGVTIAFFTLRRPAYRRQSGLDPSEATQIESLRIYPSLTRSLTGV